MTQFKRGLSTTFIERLKELDGWDKIAADKDVFIGIRDEYINVYYRGNSLFKISKNGNALKIETHYKYLSPPSAGNNGYIDITNPDDTKK